LFNDKGFYYWSLFDGIELINLIMRWRFFEIASLYQPTNILLLYICVTTYPIKRKLFKELEQV